MDTHESAGGISRFIILIPHRDALGLIEKYRGELFTAGFHGAYSFPLAAPLAAVSRPFSRDELKELAWNIRNLTKEKDGKIQSDCTALSSYPGKFSFFGPRLSLTFEENIFPATARPKILYTFSPPVLCVTLVDPEANPKSPPRGVEELPILPFPEGSPGPGGGFRAAALANLVIRPLDCGTAAPQAYSLEWKISPRVWLPAYKRA